MSQYSCATSTGEACSWQKRYANDTYISHIGYTAGALKMDPANRLAYFGA
jgi:hypothetical protein